MKHGFGVGRLGGFDHSKETKRKIILVQEVAPRQEHPGGLEVELLGLKGVSDLIISCDKSCEK